MFFTGKVLHHVFLLYSAPFSALYHVLWSLKGYSSWHHVFSLLRALSTIFFVSRRAPIQNLWLIPLQQQLIRHCISSCWGSVQGIITLSSTERVPLRAFYSSSLHIGVLYRAYILIYLCLRQHLQHLFFLICVGILQNFLWCSLNHRGILKAISAVFFCRQGHRRGWCYVPPSYNDATVLFSSFPSVTTKLYLHEIWQQGNIAVINPSYNKLRREKK